MTTWENKTIDAMSRALPDIAAAREVATAGAGVMNVHLPDDRVQVPDASRFPGSAIAQLIVTARDGQEFGATGTFIRPHVLLTAAHVLFVPGQSAASGTVLNIVVVPGRNGPGPGPFGVTSASHLYAPALWQTHSLPDFDYGLIFVPPLPAAGAFELAALPDHRLQNLGVLISGYPVDKPLGTQWYDRRSIAAVSAGQVAYDIDTETGQSGSAVFHMDGADAVAVAIHRFGDSNVNHGTRITAAILADIQSRIP